MRCSPSPALRPLGARARAPAGWRIRDAPGVPSAARRVRVRAHDRLRDPPHCADHPDPVRDHGGQFCDRAGRAGRAGRADDLASQRRHGQCDRAGQRRHRRVQNAARRQRYPLSGRARPRSGTDQGARKAIRLRQAAARALFVDDAQLYHLRFRHQLLPRPSRRRSDQGQIAGVDLDRVVDHPDHLPGLDPARHQKGSARRQPVRRMDQCRDRRRLRGAEFSVCGIADRAVRRRQLSLDLPVARPRQRQLGVIVVANAHRRLFLAHRIADQRIGDLRVRDSDDADQELLSGGDQQAIRVDRPSPRG